jgi:3-hydroxyisobutyrate dehydrogenase
MVEHTDEEAMRVAVLGTGLLGAPVARNLARQGFSVTAWNRSSEKVEALAADGCFVASSAADAVAGARAVVTVLADGEATWRVLVEDGALAAMEQGAVVIQSGTIGLDPTTRLAGACAEAGVSFLDAPVSGSRQPAEEGSLVILAGGDEPAFVAAQKVLDAMGRETVEAGGVGAGTALKMVVNTWLLTATQALAETLALAEAIGCDPEAFFRAVTGGPIGMPYVDLKGRAMVDRQFRPAAFPLRLLGKDASLGVEAGRENGQALPGLEAIARAAAALTEAGHGDDDMAALFLGLRP